MSADRWRQLVVAACRDAGIKYDSIDAITTREQTFTDSDNFRNNSVFRIGDRRIVKLYGTDARRHQNIERAVLQTIGKQIPAPRLLAEGTLETGEPYIIMSEIAGKTLEDSWTDLSPPQLRKIAGEIGSITSYLHQQPHNKLAAVEAQFGGKAELVAEMKAERATEIKGMDRFSMRHKDELLEFLNGEGLSFLDNGDVLTHSDFSHAHIYLDQTSGRPTVSGLIDWAEAMLGPPEWDIAFHWFWTFSWHRDSMQDCLNAYYQEWNRPDQFARRCFATHLYTFSMNEVWDYFDERVSESESIVRAMILSLFPPEVFGQPD